MRFGIFALPTYYPDRDGDIRRFYGNVLDFLFDAERLGFDSIWVNEHHFHPFGGMIPNPAVLLAAIANRTSRVRIGTSISILPLRHPLQVAEDYAMVDQLSGGRLEFGVGRGIAPGDYIKMGVPHETAQERLGEALEVVLRAWQERPFSYQGRFYQFQDIELWPPPVQHPHPPVWVAATRNPASFARAGSRGFNLLTVIYVRSLKELEESIRLYRETAEAHGHDPAQLQVATHYQVCVGEDGEEARRVAEEALDRYLALVADARKHLGGVPPSGLSGRQLLREGRVLAGTPEECVALLEEVRDRLGLTGVDCTFYFGGISHARARESFELFAREVMPRLRGKTAATQARGGVVA